MEDHSSTSEVGYECQPTTETAGIAAQMALFSTNMENIFRRMTTEMVKPSTVSDHISLIKYDPDEPEADIENWCRLTELIVRKKNLTGIDLLLALTSALKGRAATCLTKVNHNRLIWDDVKEILISKFAKPLVIQDYFDRVIKFAIAKDESASQAGLRLWQLIETIPDIEFS